MSAFHSVTVRLLQAEPQVTAASVRQVEEAEHRLGFRLPASVREWYCTGNALDVLAKYSNEDRPIALRDFAVTEWKTQRLLPFKIENQGVCIWAILLDGAEDPPVYVDVDSNGAQWSLLAPHFSTHVYTCVWDYTCVLDQLALVQAQNQPLSPQTLMELRARYFEQPQTFGWPGSTQYRFEGNDHALLIWARLC